MYNIKHVFYTSLASHCLMIFSQLVTSRFSDPQCRNLAPAQEHVDRSASAPVVPGTPETMCQSL